MVARNWCYKYSTYLELIVDILACFEFWIKLLDCKLFDYSLFYNKFYCNKEWSKNMHIFILDLFSCSLWFIVLILLRLQIFLIAIEFIIHSMLICMLWDYLELFCVYCMQLDFFFWLTFDVGVLLHQICKDRTSGWAW